MKRGPCCKYPPRANQPSTPMLQLHHEHHHHHHHHHHRHEQSKQKRRVRGKRIALKRTRLPARPVLPTSLKCKRWWSSGEAPIPCGAKRPGSQTASSGASGCSLDKRQGNQRPRVSNMAFCCCCCCCCCSSSCPCSSCLLACLYACVCVCVCVLLHASFWLHDLLLCLTMTRELHTCLCAGSNKTPQCGRDPAATQPPCGRLRCGYCSRVNLRKVCTRTQRLPCSEGVGVPAHTTLRARVCVCVRALMCLCLCWCLCLCNCLVSDGCRNTTSALLINMCPLLTLIVNVEWFNDNQSCSQCHAWIKMARRVCDCGMEFFTPKSAPLRPPQAMKDKSVTNCSNAIVKHVRVE